MTFSELAKYLERLEATPSRLEITRILAELFKKAEVEEIDKIVYLVLGTLAPNYKGIVFNMADKLIINALASAYKTGNDKVVEIYKKEGDLGIVAEKFAIRDTGQDKRKLPKSTTSEVYDKLMQIAQDEGEGSVERKVDKMAELLNKVDSLSARYLTRIPIGKLRLGFSDKTIIDALSWMETGGKSKSKHIGEAYNILPDVGLLAKNIKRMGIDKACRNVTPVVGIPLLPMLAQRLKSPTEMIEKMGEVFVEPKFDGLRVLIHYKKLQTSKSTNIQASNKLKNLKTEKLKNKNAKSLSNQVTKPLVRAFTRNSNDVTDMFPELMEIGNYINVDEAIFDSEAVGMDPEMKKLLDFQTTMKRRRVHQISLTAKAIPLRFQIFDILYRDGESLINLSYEDRRDILEKTFSENKLFVVDEKVRTKDPEVINEQYRKKIKEGLEGVMVKKVDAEYLAGRTGWRWVKMKQGEEAVGKLSDTVDCVVMGYTVGKGKRAGFGVGQFLVGVIGKSESKSKWGNKILTLTKIGTGLTDEQFRELKTRLTKLEVKEKPREYEAHKNYTPDYWVEPKLVVELAGDDLTKSPTHSSGYALRFPRLVNFRDDKGIGEVTTVGEIKNLFQLQK